MGGWGKKSKCRSNFLGWRGCGRGTEDSLYSAKVKKNEMGWRTKDQLGGPSGRELQAKDKKDRIGTQKPGALHQQRAVVE